MSARLYKKIKESTTWPTEQTQATEQCTLAKQLCVYGVRSRGKGKSLNGRADGFLVFGAM